MVYLIKHAEIGWKVIGVCGKEAEQSNTILNCDHKDAARHKVAHSTL